jgi:PI-3-kinase-related kinase SMG-1
MESAATMGMDQFSWEDTHLVVGQRESSGQKDIHTNVSLDAVEQRFNALVDVNSDLEPHIIRGKVLLAEVAQLFSGLERWDQGLTSLLLEIRGNRPLDLIFYLEPGAPNNGGNIWRDSRLSQDKAFFVWKVRVMDALLDLCMRDVSAIEDLTLTSEQVRLLEKRLGGLLQCYIGQYLGYRLLPALLLLVKETHPLKARPGFIPISLLD